MLSWFLGLGTSLKVLVVAAFSAVVITTVAVPTAIISTNLANTQKSQSAVPAGGNSAASSTATGVATQSATPSPITSSPAAPDNPESSNQNGKTPQTPGNPVPEVPAPAAPVVTLPNAPTGVSLGGRGCATGLDGSGNCGTSVYFTAPSDSGSGPITGYQIGYSTNGGATWGYVSAIYSPSAGQPDWDSGPTLPADPTNLLVCVRAVTSFGAGASSSSVRFQ
jgi:hypothetical protein